VLNECQRNSPHCTAEQHTQPLVSHRFIVESILDSLSFVFFYYIINDYMYLFVSIFLSVVLVLSYNCFYKPPLALSALLCSLLPFCLSLAILSSPATYFLLHARIVFYRLPFLAFQKPEKKRKKKRTKNYIKKLRNTRWYSEGGSPVGKRQVLQYPHEKNQETTKQ